MAWFCPSVLIYLASIIPAIWILELKTNRREILCSYIKLVREGGEGDERRLNMLLDLMQVRDPSRAGPSLGSGSKALTGLEVRLSLKKAENRSYPGTKWAQARGLF